MIRSGAHKASPKLHECSVRRGGEDVSVDLQAGEFHRVPDGIAKLSGIHRADGLRLRLHDFGSFGNSGQDSLCYPFKDCRSVTRSKV